MRNFKDLKLITYTEIGNVPINYPTENVNYVSIFLIYI